MPRELKEILNGGLDLDSALSKMPKNRYKDALNVSLDAVTSNNDAELTNIVSNQLIAYTYPAGDGKVIGAYPFPLRNTIIFFRYNSLLRHGIYEYNRLDNTIVKIFECFTDSASDILGFTGNIKIDSVDIFPRDEGDLLFFIDSLKRPTGLNITKFKAGAYSPVTRDILDVCKKPPLAPPANVWAADNSRRSNSLRNKLFRFKYRWVYDDFEKSTPSPIGAVALPINILTDTFTSVITNNNVINIGLSSGGKQVSKIELLMSYSEKANVWSDFVLVESIPSPADDIVFNYSFYNDGTYSSIDINESVQLHDYVPDEANAQALANGNTLCYVGITEGYDNTLVPSVAIAVNTVAAGGGGSTGSLNGTPTITNLGLFEFIRIAFSGIPPAGTVVAIKLLRTSDSVVVNAATYTTVAGDTTTQVVNGLVSSAIAIGITSNQVNNAGQFEALWSDSNYNFSALDILAPATSATANSIATFPFSTERRIGLVYFDQKGKTNGVAYNTKVTFPAYAENGSQEVLLPYINAQISHTPPDWAYSYQWVLTKENTGYKYWHTVDVKTETDFIYFNVSNFALNQEKAPATAAVLNYGFKNGDRLRLTRRMSDNTVYNDTYDAAIEGVVTDPVIGGVTTIGDFVKIKNVAPFTAVVYTTKFFVIQLYSPAQQLASDKNQTFFEFGEQYYIGDPTLVTRYHMGQVTNQSVGVPAEFNFYNGDAYFRQRSTVLSASGSATYNVLDRNFVDIYLSAVNSIDGRPNIVDENARRAYNSTMIRFGQSYQPNTNLNGLNRFFYENFDEYDLNYGDAMRLVAKDKSIIVFQKFKIGRVPLYNEIVKAANGESTLVVSDKLLNPIQYYSGDIGIGEHSGSIASDNNSIYFSTNVKGAIGRLSNAGINVLSVLYNVNSFSTTQLPQRIGNYKVYGAFDQSLYKYVIALEATDTEDAYTLVFDEKRNVFESFMSYHPEMMCNLETLFVSFKNGNLYTHDAATYNEFYGVEYPSSVSLVFNENSPIRKKYNAIGYQSYQDKRWAAPLITTNTVNSQTGLGQESSLLKRDFILEETVLTAGLLKDKNSRLNPVEGLNEGDYLGGNYIVVKLEMSAADANDLVSLVQPYLTYQISNRNF